MLKQQLCQALRCALALHAGELAELEALVRRERQLRAAAEQANRSKDELLSMFSHELRSPLNAILGWNRILAVKRAGDAEVAAVTARIERSAKAQLKMIDDLLDLGRIGAGKLKIESPPTRLASVVAAALEELAARGARYDVVVTDIGMPAEDGYSLVRKLRRAPFGERVIVVALTGYASRRDREAALRAGFDVHVAKPVDFDAFVPLIARMTRNARPVRGH